MENITYHLFMYCVDEFRDRNLPTSGLSQMTWNFINHHQFDVNKDYVYSKLKQDLIIPFSDLHEKLYIVFFDDELKNIFNNFVGKTLIFIDPLNSKIQVINPILKI